MSCSIIKGADTLSVFIGGKPYFFPSNSSEAKTIVEMVKNGCSDEEILASFSNQKMKDYCEDMKSEGVVITDDTILIDGEGISRSLAEQIRRHYDEGLSIDPLVKFVQKVRQNPSYRIRNQLWAFIEASQNSGGFTLAEDGDILAYKKVRGDYKDIHSGTFDNSVGQIVEMERKNVDDDPNNTCSSGLHFCAYSYLSCYASDSDIRIMLVKVNPADVVSIPTDYGNAKARCCRYEVVQEVEHIITEPVYSDYDVDDDPTDDWNDDEEQDLFNEIMSSSEDMIRAFCVWMEYKIDREYNEIFYEMCSDYGYKYIHNEWRNFVDWGYKEYLENFEGKLNSFKDRDKDYLYKFICESDIPYIMPLPYTYDGCIDVIKDFLSDRPEETMKKWNSYCRESERASFNEDFDEFLSNYTKRELINFYNFVANKNYKFQNKTKWQMVEIMKELFDEIPPTKDKNVFIKAWLATKDKTFESVLEKIYN